MSRLTEKYWEDTADTGWKPKVGERVRVPWVEGTDKQKLYRGKITSVTKDGRDVEFQVQGKGSSWPVPKKVWGQCQVQRTRDVELEREVAGKTRYFEVQKGENITLAQIAAANEVDVRVVIAMTMRSNPGLELRGKAVWSL